jgi:hypothetical protein
MGDDRKLVQLFLCYARRDRCAVEQLYDRLLDEGFKPWMDTRDIFPGEVWKAAINKALCCSAFFLTYLSHN